MAAASGMGDSVKWGGGGGEGAVVISKEITHRKVGD